MVDRRTVKVLALYGVGAIGALGIATAGRMLASPDSAVHLLVMLAAIAWALAFSGMAWRHTDEAAREAHKAAAFWGAPFGLLAVMLAVAMAAAPELRAAGPAGIHLSSPGQLLPGVVLAALGLGAGYLVVWIGWWIRKR